MRKEDSQDKFTKQSSKMSSFAKQPAESTFANRPVGDSYDEVAEGPMDRRVRPGSRSSLLRASGETPAQKERPISKYKQKLDEMAAA